MGKIQMPPRKRFRIPKFVSGALGGLAGAATGFAAGGPLGAVTGGIGGVKSGLGVHQSLKDIGLPFAGRRGRKKRKVGRRRRAKKRGRKR